MTGMVSLHVNMSESFGHSTHHLPSHTTSHSAPLSFTMNKSLDITGHDTRASTYASSDFNDEDQKDHWCNPEEPKIVKWCNQQNNLDIILFRFEEIAAAAYTIKDHIVKTSCDISHLNQDVNMTMYFKKDYMQYTGSFKERGAR